MITCCRNTEKELDIICKLLVENKLLYSDIAKSRILFFTALKDNEIVGCIGLEEYGKDGLLRSFVVAPEFHNQGIGTQLFVFFISYCKNHKIEVLHLLTTTASGYFEKRGFQFAMRGKAPQSIAGSAEFASLCPVSAQYMTIKL